MSLNKFDNNYGILSNLSYDETLLDGYYIDLPVAGNKNELKEFKVFKLLDFEESYVHSRFLKDNNSCKHYKNVILKVGIQNEYIFSTNKIEFVQYFEDRLIFEYANKNNEKNTP